MAHQKDQSHQYIPTNLRREEDENENENENAGMITPKLPGVPPWSSSWSTGRCRANMS